MAMISIKNLTKRYGEKVIYEDFSFDIEDGKITVVLGESGSGKTTLLNVIADLTDYEGRVEKDTPVSMVFQSGRLVPNLTVKENLELVCKDIDVLEELKSLGLESKINAYPKTLSGGEARRIAILRALKYPHKVLLLDEPFINLDVALKFSLIKRIKKENADKKNTVLLVTHDITEAVNLADRIVVLNKRKIVLDEKAVNDTTGQKLFDFMMNLR